jgi:phosphoesterase RecJ-like protein
MILLNMHGGGSMWNEIAAIIKRGKKFLITTHVNPDGDAIGSELALHAFLRILGKESRIINGNLTPDRYSFLDTEGDIEVYSEEEHSAKDFDCDAIFVLDISNLARLGALGGLVQSSRTRKVCIDHHISNDRFADVNVIQPAASATGELIYDLIMSMRGWLDGRIALFLYVSILTDTGGFRFSNTSGRTHIITSHLLSAGVDPRMVYEKIYENNSAGQVRLLARLLDSLRITDDGRVAWVRVSRSDFGDTGSSPDELDGMIDHLRAIEGVEVCLLFLEREVRGTKVSLRSKNDFDVNLFASRFGGGGHKNAAGMIIEKDLDDSIDMIVSELEAEYGASRA